MPQRFTARDFANVGNIRIEGRTFGDKLSNSVNFITDFLGFGIQSGVNSVQSMINSVSPGSVQSSGQPIQGRSLFEEFNPDDTEDPDFTEQDSAR